MRLASFALLACSAWSQVSLPTAGLARFQDGTVRHVTGVSGSLVAGEPVLSSVRSFASSGEIGLAKLDDRLVVLAPSGRVLSEAPSLPGPAVIGFSGDGRTALVYLESGPALVRCSAAGCSEAAPVPVANVRAVALAGRYALLGTDTEVVRVRLSDGAMTHLHPVERAPALLAPDGTPKSLPEGSQAEWMAPDWIHISYSDGRSSAWNTATGAITVLSADTAFSIVLYDGRTETPVAGTLDLGSFATGDVREFRFRVRNPGTTPVTLDSIRADNAAFKISNAPSVPYVIAAQSFVEVRVGFTAGPEKSYDGWLRINTTDLKLHAAVTPSFAITVDSTSIGAGATVDFGRMIRGSTATRRVVVANPSASAMTLRVPTISGNGFRLSNAPLADVDLAPGQTLAFDIVFAPPASGDFQGSLTINNVSLKLSAAAYDPPLPRPILDIGTGPWTSASQQTLRIRFGTAAATSGSGTLKMEFRSSSIAATDDSAIRFLSGGARVQTFTFAEGDLSASFGSAQEVLFQTGTTAGTIVLTAESGSYSEQATVRIAPSRIGFDQVGAVATPGTITVTITGYDNDRSAGSLAFTFYDRSGKPIGAVIPVDVKAQFNRFFDANPAGGGAFLLRLAFPVSGDISQVGTVDVRIANGIEASSVDRLAIN